MFTTYNHVLGSAWTNAGMLPVDFEDDRVEEIGGTLRQDLDPTEPSQEYTSYSADVINANLFYASAVADDAEYEIMDVDTVAEYFSEDYYEDEDDDGYDNDSEEED